MIKLALFGYGTVGEGVYRLLQKRADIEVVKVFDREEKRKELGSLLETDPEKILSDPSIDTIVECLGGDTLPHQIISSALMNGKNVVSSNKETISKHLKEYSSLAKEHSVSLQFEAAVGGGIPLLYPLLIERSFDEIRGIRAILNGTTNYVLTRMEEGMSFQEAIALAQEKGFAEKDPTADLEGLDMVRKASIIASLVTGKEIRNEEIPHFGLSHLTKEVLEKIEKRDRVLKFVSEINFERENSLSISVLPVALKKDDPLASVTEEINGAYVDCLNNGPLFFTGKGAGKYPTASAILQDLIRLEKGIAYPLPEITETASVKDGSQGTFLAYTEEGEEGELVDPNEEELHQYPFIVKLS